MIAGKGFDLFVNAIHRACSDILVCSLEVNTPVISRCRLAAHHTVQFTWAITSIT